MAVDAPRRGQSAPAFLPLAADPLRWQLLIELARSDRRVRELCDLVEEPQSLVSYHLGKLRAEGVVSRRPSAADGRDSYYALELARCGELLAASGAALHPALGRDGTSPLPGGAAPVSVLFVCTGNSTRSPIAEALLRHRTGGGVTVASAGSRPKEGLHPHAVRVLREVFGIDVGDRRPRHLDAVAGNGFDHVITLCDRARESCPEFPDHPRRAHWSIPDPDGASYPAFRHTAADIDTRVRHLVPVLAGTDRTATDRSEVHP
jgi:protein-tyrosine-phosphatase/DNA-binding transcriptional ArsR family regulator